MKAIDDGLRSAASMAPGTASLDAGIFANTLEIGGKVSGKTRFNENFYGFVEARGGYSYALNTVFGEAFAGVGGRW